MAEISKKEITDILRATAKCGLCGAYVDRSDIEVWQVDVRVAECLTNPPEGTATLKVCSDDGCHTDAIVRGFGLPEWWANEEGRPL